MKEKNNKLKLIIFLLIIALITVLLAYLFSDKLALTRNNKDVKEESGASSNKLACVYNKLTSTSDLTSSDIESIISLMEKKLDNLAIENSSVKINMYNDYIYKIEFELIEKTGAYLFEDYVWKENNGFKSLGPGSSHTTDEIEKIESKICGSCGNCNVNKACSYEKLNEPESLPNVEKENIISAIEKQDGYTKIDYDTLKISLYDKYIYKVEFELNEKVGAYKLEDYFWKENGSWKSLGAGSSFTKDELETLQGVISVACTN